MKVRRFRFYAKREDLQAILEEFQSKFDRFQASFTEVSGLNMQLSTEEKTSDSGMWIKMPVINKMERRQSEEYIKKKK